MPGARPLVGSHDILLLTLDTLRYDVAAEEFAGGRTPNLAAVLPASGWEARHTSATFTYAAHHAFLAGFLPTPAVPGKQARPFAARFEGSETTGPDTWTFDAANLPSALAQAGYRTLCIGGVGFFNKRTALGRAIPSLFEESFWEPRMGVTSAISTETQVALAARLLEETPLSRRVFLFINIAAIHHPNRIFVPGAARDTRETHAAALRYVDGALPPLFEALRRRGPSLCIVCSDHGTAYGEDGFHGHRLAHPVVWTVPYAEWVLQGGSS
jgi:arylsulfatase A-like enzyme